MPTAEFYAWNADDWRFEWKRVRDPLPPAGVREVPGALLLPLRKKMVDGTWFRLFEGGLCDASGAFVAGRVRSLSDPNANLSVTSAYTVSSEEVEFRDEDVVFGGLLFAHWGHLITDSTARLWYVVAHPEDRRKIVFLKRPGKSLWAAEDWQPLFKLAGIDVSRIEIVEKPTRFRSATVPEEAFHSLSAFRPEWISFFDAVRKNTKPSPHRKVYFSRTRCKRNDVFNEDIFEASYRANGFHVVYPEECSLEEEIAFASGADEVVSTMGTLSHNFLFCGSGTKATVLLRAPSVVVPQLLIGAARGLRCTYVAAYRNVLPAYHTDCVFYLAPTVHVDAFFAASGLPPLKKGRKEILSLKRIRPYVAKWLEDLSLRHHVFEHSPYFEHRARGGLAEVYASVADPALREKFADGVASLVFDVLRLEAKIGETADSSIPVRRRFDLLYPLRLVWRAFLKRYRRHKKKS